MPSICQASRAAFQNFKAHFTQCHAVGSQPHRSLLAVYWFAGALVRIKRDISAKSHVSLVTCDGMVVPPAEQPGEPVVADTA